MDRPFNRFVLAGPAGERYHYDKIHPFSYGHEDEHYAAGDGRVTVDVEGVRVTLFVCYDLRFADQWWAAARDTDCYVVVANWPAGRREHWRTLARARAIENQAYVVAANRVGSGGGLEYAGDSAVYGPFGEELAVAADTGPSAPRRSCTPTSTPTTSPRSAPSTHSSRTDVPSAMVARMARPKTLAIVGAGPGLGAALARRFAREG